MVISTYVGTRAAESAIIGTASQSTCSAGSGTWCLAMGSKLGPVEKNVPTSLSDASSKCPSPITSISVYLNNVYIYHGHTQGQGIGRTLGGVCELDSSGQRQHPHRSLVF